MNVYIYIHTHTDKRRVTTGLRSEKCVVRRFRRCAKVIECTYTNLLSIAYYTPSLGARGGAVVKALRYKLEFLVT